MDTNNCFTHITSIFESTGSGLKRASLFTHGLYYLQNEIKDEELRDQCKAYLYLCTLPFAYEVADNFTHIKPFFNHKPSIEYKELHNKSAYREANLGGTSLVPYGYLLSIGAQMWRRKYMSEHKKEPINVIIGNKNYYHTPGYDKVWIGKVPICYFYDGLTCCRSYKKQDSSHYDYTDIVKTEDNKVVVNRLIDLFLDFAKNDFQTIKNSCELRLKSDNYIMSIQGSFWFNWFEKKMPTCTPTTVMRYMNGDKAISGYTFIYDGKEVKDFKITNFVGNYVIAFYTKGEADGKMKAFYTEDNKIQTIFREIYLKEVITIYIPTKISQNISKDTLKKYYVGFANGLKYYMNDLKQNEAKSNTENTSDDERDFKCELYLTLKNIWDRWACGYYNQTNGRDMFTVNNFFKNNFIFIDSFYNNIYDTMKLNCEYLLKHYNGGANTNSRLGKTVVNYLGDVASHHGSMMFNFPDSLNFSGLDSDGHIDEDSLVKHMNEMFTPMPVNKIGKMEYSNKFTIIYTHSGNKLDTNDRNKFNSDSFDIWSYDEGTEVVPTTFKHSIYGSGDSEREKLSPEFRMAYKVPSFGVAYSQQNNSLWKSIDVSMDNMSVTEQTIMAESVIAEKGNSEKSNVCFYGQDLFHIYQTYSYMVTVEMLGNAQIQPLMYFQLMNVPMFRGTYMIISVEHSITPGMMTTKFTGMKMSKVQVPFTESWFTTSKDEEYHEPDSNQDESNDGEYKLTSNDDGTTIDLADNKLSQAIIESMGMGDNNQFCDVFVRNVYKKYSDNHLVIDGGLNGNMFDNISKSSDWRTNKFRKTPRKSNDWKSLTKGAVRPKVGDLLFGYHDDTTFGNFNHVAIYLGLHGGGMYVAEGVSVSGKNVQNKTNGIQIVRIENSRFGLKSDIISHFSHCTKYEVEQVVKQSSSEVAKQSSSVEFNNVEIKTIPITDEQKKKNGLFIMKQLVETGFVLNGEKIKLTPMQAAAIAGVWYQESAWTPVIFNPTSKAYGLAQWLGPRKYGNYINFYCKEKNITPKRSDATNMDTIEEQIEYAKWEFNRPYYKSTCRLWGNDAEWKNQWGWKSGNLMVYKDDYVYSDNKLYDLVYRFTVGYENGKAPEHSEFAVDNRAKYAKMAYNLYINSKTS